MEAHLSACIRSLRDSLKGAADSWIDHEDAVAAAVDLLESDANPGASVDLERARPHAAQVVATAQLIRAFDRIELIKALLSRLPRVGHNADVDSGAVLAAADAVLAARDRRQIAESQLKDLAVATEHPFGLPWLSALSASLALLRGERREAESQWRSGREPANPSRQQMVLNLLSAADEAGKAALLELSSLVRLAELLSDVGLGIDAATDAEHNHKSALAEISRGSVRFGRSDAQIQWNPSFYDFPDSTRQALQANGPLDAEAGAEAAAGAERLSRDAIAVVNLGPHAAEAVVGESGELPADSCIEFGDHVPTGSTLTDTVLCIRVRAGTPLYGRGTDHPAHGRAAGNPNPLRYRVTRVVTRSDGRAWIYAEALADVEIPSPASPSGPELDGDNERDDDGWLDQLLAEADDDLTKPLSAIVDVDGGIRALADMLASKPDAQDPPQLLTALKGIRHFRLDTHTPGEISIAIPDRDHHWLASALAEYEIDGRALDGLKDELANAFAADDVIRAASDPAAGRIQCQFGDHDVTVNVYMFTSEDFEFASDRLCRSGRADAALTPREFAAAAIEERRLRRGDYFGRAALDPSSCVPWFYEAALSLDIAADNAEPDPDAAALTPTPRA